MTYNDVTAEIGVDLPIFASTISSLMGNFPGLANGDPGAPPIQSVAIGGAGIDGDVTETELATFNGLKRMLQASTLTVAGAVSLLSPMNVLYVQGNTTISDTITVPQIETGTYDYGASWADAAWIQPRYLGIPPDPIPAATSVTDELYKNYLGIPVFRGGIGSQNGAFGNGGGGFGDGSDGNGNTTTVTQTGRGLKNLFANDLGLRRGFFVGGAGGDDGAVIERGTGGIGGGCLILIVEGDLTLSGIIRAVGESNAPAISETGGGGGGTVLIYCTGTLNGLGGLIDVSGGDGGGGTPIGGGGGGGYIGIYAAAVSNLPTLDFSGGVYNIGGPNANQDGLAEVNQLNGANYAYTPGQIRKIIHSLGYA